MYGVKQVLPSNSPFCFLDEGIFESFLFHAEKIHTQSHIVEAAYYLTLKYKSPSTNKNSATASLDSKHMLTYDNNKVHRSNKINTFFTP